jgi:hypothetical protein
MPGRRPSGCESFFSSDSSGKNATPAALQAQYAAWRPYYTASLRKVLPPQSIIIANAGAGFISDPSLNGITVEFEHCAGDQNPHATAGAAAGAAAAPGAAELQPTLNDVCRQTFLGQRALTDTSGLSPVFGLWLTHSEVLSAPQQCAELASIRSELPWIREGDDITDCTREGGPASCVHCNSTA